MYLGKKQSFSSLVTLVTKRIVSSLGTCFIKPRTEKFISLSTGGFFGKPKNPPGWKPRDVIIILTPPLSPPFIVRSMKKKIIKSSLNHLYLNIFGHDQYLGKHQVTNLKETLTARYIWILSITFCFFWMVYQSNKKKNHFDPSLLIVSYLRTCFIFSK